MEIIESKRNMRGQKIIFSCRTSTRSGVGVIMEEMKSKVVVIGRKSKRIMTVKLVFEEKVFNVI